MTRRYRPSRADLVAIREAARREARFEHTGQVLLEVGRRQSLVTGEVAINFAFISDDPDWRDTDLDDYRPWPTFARGVALTGDGRGMFDFYIRRRGDPDAELHGNISVRIEEGRLSAIHGYPDSYPVPTP